MQLPLGWKGCSFPCHKPRVVMRGAGEIWALSPHHKEDRIQHNSPAPSQPGHRTALGMWRGKTEPPTRKGQLSIYLSSQPAPYASLCLTLFTLLYPSIPIPIPLSIHFHSHPSSHPSPFTPLCLAPFTPLYPSVPIHTPCSTYLVSV